MKVLVTRFIVFILIIIASIHLYQEEHSLKNKHWTYEGETAPEHWAEIEKDSDCNGRNQSPINIVEINTQLVEKAKDDLNIHYSPFTFINSVVNNGHSIQFNFERGDSLQYKNKVYHLAQIHFHEPAEHTINGIRYPLEIHLVHANEDNSYTVMAIVAKEGIESDIFEFLESFLPIEVNDEKTIHEPLDLTTLFPKDKSYFSYKGSLTTPPCSESVDWIIFKEPIIVSVEEVLKLKKNMPKDNYRNEQPLNDRIVELHLR
ncbi:MAG: carbonate dehydratase [Flavobacteriaceae bacterium]|nr:carbonate dehydratase [Flavobacteriaceae bacterium]|tara:strand:- start:188290 stop:189069 length:780 start_codon:yes stop_codon:yes gene_type:complete